MFREVMKPYDITALLWRRSKIARPFTGSWTMRPDRYYKLMNRLDNIDALIIKKAQKLE